MLAVPVSFVSEHIETLEEMDMEYRELVRRFCTYCCSRIVAPLIVCACCKLGTGPARMQHLSFCMFSC